MTEIIAAAFEAALEKGHRIGIAKVLYDQAYPMLTFRAGKHRLEFKQGSLKELEQQLQIFIETGKCE